MKNVFFSVVTIVTIVGSRLGLRKNSWKFKDDEMQDADMIHALPQSSTSQNLSREDAEILSMIAPVRPQAISTREKFFFSLKVATIHACLFVLVSTLVPTMTTKKYLDLVLKGAVFAIVSLVVTFVLPSSSCKT